MLPQTVPEVTITPAKEVVALRLGLPVILLIVGLVIPALHSQAGLLTAIYLAVYLLSTVILYRRLENMVTTFDDFISYDIAPAPRPKSNRLQARLNNLEYRLNTAMTPGKWLVSSRTALLPLFEVAVPVWLAFTTFAFYQNSLNLAPLAIIAPILIVIQGTACDSALTGLVSDANRLLKRAAEEHTEPKSNYPRTPGGTMPEWIPNDPDRPHGHDPHDPPPPNPTGPKQ